MLAQVSEQGGHAWDNNRKTRKLEFIDFGGVGGGDSTPMFILLVTSDLSWNPQNPIQELREPSGKEVKGLARKFC